MSATAVARLRLSPAEAGEVYAVLVALGAKPEREQAFRNWLESAAEERFRFLARFNDRRRPSRLSLGFSARDGRVTAAARQRLSDDQYDLITEATWRISQILAAPARISERSPRRRLSTLAELEAVSC